MWPRPGKTIVPSRGALLDAAGNPVTALSGVKVTVTMLNCAAWTSVDAVEEYEQGLRLQNLGDRYYQDSWKTSKTYASSCETLHLVGLLEMV